MKLSNNLKSRAPDESLCSLLVGFTFVFFTGLLACLLILPLKTVFVSSDEGHGEGHGADGDSHASAGDVTPIKSLSAGKAAYQTCSMCHGNDGEGNAALNAPALAGQEAWYLKRQLQKFKDGVRGTHPDDVYGMQMRRWR